MCRSRNGPSQRRSQGGRLIEPSSELEVLKCIMLRESYLERVTRLSDDMERRAQRSRGQVRDLPPGMVDLLDLLRVATLDAVEAISLWRLSQATPTRAPFEWNGQNYLIKMLHDCDFLDRVEPLRRWLGCRTSCNPFFVPLSSQSDTGDGSTDLEGCRPLAETRLDNTGLADVGRQSSLGPFEVACEMENFVGGGNKGWTGNRNKRKERFSDGASPYAAAVVNDPTLLPPTKALPPSRGGGPSSVENAAVKGGVSGGLVVRVTVNVEGLVPNIVSREDMQRVGVARQVLIEEEMRVVAATAIAVVAEEGASRSPTRSSDSPTPRKDSQNISLSTSDSRKRASRSRAGLTLGSLQKKHGKVPFHAASSLSARNVASTPVSPNADIRSLSLSAAGLIKEPPPEPHPGLGPVLLRSDLPGGEFYRNPFLHTVTNSSIDEQAPHTIKVSTSASDGSLETATARDRCSTAPAVPLASNDFVEPREPRDFSDRSLTDRDHRASTAPSTMMFMNSASLTPSFMVGEASHVHRQGSRSGKSRQRSDSKGRARLNAIRARRHLSRKAGAELRALTAAGTSGRRQPPPREARLRRLARDVERHSAELRSLAKEEEKLGKSLTLLKGNARGESFSSLKGGAREESCSTERDEGVDTVRISADQQQQQQREGAGFTSANTTDPPADRIEALLGEKRQEIALKSFHLGVKRDELRCLLMVQKHERHRKRDLELERLRARLQEGQSLPQDEATAETLEDASCLLVQKRFRGNVDRKYAAWYKSHIHQAATTIQRGVRYIWDRRATARRLRLEASVTLIQAAIRMFVQRQRYTRRLSERERAIACFKLQTVCQGMKGRTRAKARRAMKTAAGKALEWVSLEMLQPKHLKELARAIHGALVDPVRQFPPAGILGAIRVALTILEDAHTENGAENGTENKFENGSGRNVDTVTFQTALGRTLRGAVCAPDLTWEMAARVLGRPFRLLRRMRAFASGLGASSDQTPVRLLHLSPKAAELLRAYRHDPSWSEEALHAIEEGGTAAASLVGWARELERVYREQPRVREFLRDAQPAWLRKSRSLQKRRRATQLRAEACRFAVTVARQYYLKLETEGRAYGDPLAALDVLEAQSEDAEAAVGALEGRRRELRAVQEKAEEAEGRKLRHGMEFAEREAAVAARAEEMALRLGNCGPEELATLATKRIEWEVISRELSRRFCVWKRRCQEDNRPLLEEWVPPTQGQTVMAQSVGAARAWEQITAAQKGRLIDEAGGRRFIKGLKGRRMETWRSVSEGLMSCREDVESGEARLVADVRTFEQRVLTVNEEAAAKKVSLAEWDNATEVTKALEREEDADAARDELRTAMGAIIPRGLLEDTSKPRTEGGNSPSGPSRRPTLVLLGLDLPEAVRDSIRANLDRDAPSIFGLHITGDNTLPSLAAAARSRDRGFLDPCRQSAPKLSPRAQGGTPTHGRGQEHLPSGSEMLGDGGGYHGKHPPGDCERMHGQTKMESTRTGRLQAALSAGKSASLEVVPGPGLWARGRFLRDLEALLRGLDDCGCREKSVDASRRGGFTVVLMEGHNRNRSGGGADVKYGTKYATTVTNISRANDWKAESPARHGLDGLEQGLPSPAMLVARRTKALLEQAAQCLHDLSTTHGDTPTPFAAKAASTTRTGDERLRRFDGAEPSHVLDSSDGGADAESELIDSLQSKSSSPGLELLLAACHMITHPDRQYDLRDRRVGHKRASNTPEKSSKPSTEEWTGFDNVIEENAALTVASCLAAKCRQTLAEMRSARDVANFLREVDITSVPFDTAVSLRLLLRHPAWPAASPRSSAGGCFSSEAFCGWVVAAVVAATEIAITGGGSSQGSNSDSSQKHRGGKDRTVTKPGKAEQDPQGGGVSMGLSLKTRGKGSREFPTLEDVRHERELERELLQGLETSMVDEIITIVDEDLPQLLRKRGGESGITAEGGPRRRQCRAAEAFNALMETVLIPFQVFETAEHSIRVVGGEQASDITIPPSATKQPGEPPRDVKFRVTVSRAFGSIYVRAGPLDAQRPTRRHAMMARIKDEDLIPLISPNWMEIHELSALRELRNEPAVWRALADTLVVHYPTNTPQHMTGDGAHIATMDPPMGGYGGEVLSFCHPRRLTLESSCLYMGRLVPIKVFEECRSDFWCEAQLPPSLEFFGTTSCSVGMRIPKEFIQLLLDDDHPMRMQTMLDAFDLRELSTLIADRLKLCRVGSTTARRGVRSYRYWLDGAIGEGDQPETTDPPTAAETATGETQEGGPKPREFRLSLRKRGVGQVLFSRLVSFWVPGDRKHRLSEEGSNTNGGSARDDGNGNREPPTISPNVAKIVQILVSVKEIAHRGERGELRGETHDPYVGGRPGKFVLAPELTRMLQENSYTKTKTDGMQWKRAGQYWRDAITWRLMATVEYRLPETGVGASGDRLSDEYVASDTSASSAGRPQGEGNSSIKISVDEREPLFSLDLVSAQCETPPAAGLQNAEGKSSKVVKTLFDILLLPPREMEKYPETRRSIPAIELVATHRHTMAVFRFSVPAKTFVAEYRGVLAACLAVPAALRTELELPASAALRDMAGRWLHYSPADRSDGRRATLTFSFPGLGSVTTEPYVGLRGEGYERVDFGQQAEAKSTDSAAQWRRQSSFHVRENVRTVERTSPRGRPQTARGHVSEGETTPLQAEASNKNERMVLRRSLAVPQLDALERRQKNPSAGEKHERGLEEEETTGSTSKVLVLSVFEVFSTGPEGRVARHLKLCARDESVRPAVETATVIPWVGTCEGVEGGELWRVITQGLGFTYILNKRGKHVGIRLQVSPQRDTEAPSRLCAPQLGPNKPETHSPAVSEVDAPAALAGKGGEGFASLGDSSRQHGAQTIPLAFSEEHTGPTACLDAPQANLQKGTAKDNEPPSTVRTKIYDGWHRITGIRLHVQCLQEEPCGPFKADGMANSGNVDVRENPRCPAGRGGTVSFPRASILRFCLCDPRTGLRSEVQLSVEDALRNLSTRGGVVEARLLDAGRRPALAKAVVQQLQLIFDPTGGYRVTLLLPAGWKRTASPQDGSVSL
ncbi:unnamed protein product [Laminaria digitata]